MVSHMQNNFPQVYSNELLQTLERDFKFEPSINKSPKVLQNNEIESFNDKGYLPENYGNG
jgi:hypothetical protein